MPEGPAKRLSASIALQSTLTPGPTLTTPEGRPTRQPRSSTPHRCTAQNSPERSLCAPATAPGRLKTSHEGRLLPFNEQGLENEGGRDLESLFVAGDVRANEQIGLIAMHTLFVREHNRLADIIADQDPDLSGDEIYQLARKIVGAQNQAVTFNEFLPLLLGPDAIGAYTGYDPSVDPAIASEFSAAAFRVGHTMLSPTSSSSAPTDNKSR